jgi:putative PEP-CTERM system TPR-repeat lipoprotein
MNVKLKVVVPVLLIMLSACGGELTGTEYLAKASQYIEQKDNQSAIIEIKNALKQNAADQEAHAMLGDLMLQLEQYGLASVEFEKLKQFGAASDVWVLGLTEVQFKTGQADAVLSQDETGLGDKNLARLLSYKIMVLVDQSKFDEAEALISKTEALKQNIDDLTIAKSRLLMRTGKLDEAKVLLESVIATNAENFDAYSLIGDIGRKHKNIEAARAAYSKASELRPNSLPIQLQVIALDVQEKAYEKAQNRLNGLLKRHPSNAMANHLQGKVYLEQAKKVKALPFFEKAVNAQNPPLESLYLKAALDLENNQIESADQFINRFLAKEKRIPDAYLLQASIRLKQNLPDESEALARNVLAVLPEHTKALTILSAALMQQGKVSEGIKGLEKLVKIAPDSEEAKFMLAKSYLAAGRYELVKKIIANLLDANPKNNQAKVIEVMMYTNLKEFDKALSLSQALKAEMPNSALPFILEGKAYESNKQLDVAVNAFEKACEVEQPRFQACFELGDFLVKQQEFAEAGKAYDKVDERFKGTLLVMLKKAQIFALLNKIDDVEKQLQATIDKHPNTLKPKVLLGRLYLKQGRADKTNRVLVDAQGDAANKMSYLELKASAFLAEGKLKDAEVVTKKMMAIQPSYKQAVLLDARVQSGLGNNAKAEERLRSILANEPADNQLKFALAKVLVSSGKVAEAEKLISQFPKVSLGYPDVLELKSTIAAFKGDTKQATKLALQVFEKQPTSKNLLALVQRKWVNKEQAEGFQQMDDWLEKNPNDLAVRNVLATLHQQEGRLDDAMVQYEKVLELDPNNALALNNMAWQLQDSNPIKALELANLLVDKVPKSSAAQDTLAVVLLKNNELDRASEIIARALDKSPGNPTYIFHQAMIDNKKGDWLLAIKSLTSMLEKDINFPERSEAEALLATLKAGN